MCRVKELQEQDLETFGCKHGLVAALVFQSEHVALDFRRPSTEVEVQKPLRTRYTIAYRILLIESGQSKLKHSANFCMSFFVLLRGIGNGVVKC